LISTGHLRALFVFGILVSALGATTLLGVASADDETLGVDAGLASHVTWERTVRVPFARKTVYRIDFSNPGVNRIVAHGRDGVKILVVRYERNGTAVQHRIVRRSIVRTAHARIVRVGLGPLGAMLRLDRHALARFGLVARHALEMTATAYTPYCNGGCDGVTATGRRAGPGVVAVDPHVIPLGSHLYIPGYGFAIAGDTGGSIQGNRIDLGFSSYRAAVRFGCRSVTVYRLTR
jgi:3D (Asp-Asp-Asp) domain-containing protein